MAAIDILEVQAELDKLVTLAEQGQDTIIIRAGLPVARLTQLPAIKRPLRYGALKGKIHIADDFDEPFPADFLITPENIV